MNLKFPFREPLSWLPLLLLALSGCGEDGNPTRNNDFIPLTEITVASEYPEVPAGVENRFTAVGNFSGVFTRELDDVDWSSNNAEVLEIGESGIGHAIAAGSATVTAERDGLTGSIEFSVNGEILETVTLTPDTVELSPGSTRQLTTRGTFSQGGNFPLTGGSWASADEAVVTVDQAGMVTAVAVGESPVTVTATFESFGGIPGQVQGQASVTVVEAALESITLQADGVNDALEVSRFSDPLPFRAMGVFSDGTEEEITSQVTWTSSDEEVGTVDAAGLVEIVGVGTTEITANFENLTATEELVVDDLLSLSFDRASPLTVSRADGGVTLVAEGNLENSTETDDLSDEVLWSSSNPNVATVENGVITLGTTGFTRITARLDDPDTSFLDDFTATLDLTVTE